MRERHGWLGGLALVMVMVMVMVMPVLVGCGGGDINLDNPQGASTDPTAACTDAQKCCPKEKVVCEGNPDGQVVCACSDLWDCSKNPAKCEQPKPVPPGGGQWTCTWNKTAYACVAKGSKSSPPAGGNGWTCTYVSLLQSWVCQKDFPPNPSNTPAGGTAWTCTVDELHGKLVCDRTPPAQPPPTQPPPTQPPTLPPWPSAPDAGVKPPPTPPPPKPGEACVAGQKRWCDGPVYCGWGQQDCAPDGHWGECVELQNGLRPNTACACYSFMFDESCCETSDCILPAGTTGTDCSTGSAGKLCDPCNPQKPSCTEPGGKCVVISGKSFCGKGCSSQQPCPSGYMCINQNGGAQCIPVTMQCTKP